MAVVTAQIRSQDDLDTYINDQLHSPLANLSERDRWTFISSLTFSEKGLSGFNYEILQENLTTQNIFNVLSLFGVEHVTLKIVDAKSKKKLSRQSARTISEFELKLRSFSSMNFHDGDHEGFYCASRATCSPRNSDICLSHC